MSDTHSPSSAATEAKYALSDEMSRAVKTADLTGTIYYSLLLSVLVAFIPVTVLLAGNYDHLYGGKSLPPLLLGMGITFSLALVTMVIATYAVGIVGQATEKRLQSDRLTARIADDHGLPVVVVAEYLTGVADGTKQSFTHGDELFEMTRWRKRDVQIDKKVTYIQIERAKMTSVIDDLIVP